MNEKFDFDSNGVLPLVENVMSSFEFVVVLDTAGVSSYFFDERMYLIFILLFYQPFSHFSQLSTTARTDRYFFNTDIFI